MSHESADTRVTAYVFGELSPEETAAFEEEMQQSSHLSDEVAATREAVSAISAEFEAEAPSIKDAQRKQIEHAIGNVSSSSVSVDNGTPPIGHKLMIFAALAASLLIVCGLIYPRLNWQDDPLSLSQSNPPQPPSGMKSADGMKSAGESFPDVASDQFAGKASGMGAKSAPQNLPGGQSAAEEESLPFAKGGPVGNDESTQADRDFLNRVNQQRTATESRLNSEVQAEQRISPVDRDERKEKAAETDPMQPFGADPALGNAAPSNGLGDRATEFSDPFQASLPGSRGATAAKDAPASRSKALKGMPDPSSQGSDAPAASAPTQTPLMPLAESPAARQYGRQQQQEQLGQSMKSADSPSRDRMVEDESLFGVAESDSPAAPSKGRGIGQAANDSLALDGKKSAAVAATATREARRLPAGASIGGESEMEEMMDMMDVNSMGMGMGAGMGGDQFEPIQDNPFMEVKSEPLSTFSVDVDTASYAKVRMYLLQQNSLPRPDAVRIEELVNYFRYDYPPPSDEHPFAATMDIAECPWNAGHRLARIGIKGRVIEDNRPSSNLVFLLDVSGSMDQPNKLPLVIEGMKMLTDQLGENDSVAIVVYAGAAGLVLDSTHGDDKQTIVSALERLKAGGSTNGGQGITLAYQIARDNFIVGGTNRVILCSDGDFNVGVTSNGDLVRIAEENAKGNIYLSVLGFGMGNHNDSMMEQISNKGNGNYAFIDSKSEAQKVLVEEMGGTLVTIAKDVKIQVEFNPKEIASYRLIGYENRILAAQDFNDDMKDAGEIGAGHTVTALYELVPTGAKTEVSVPPVDDLRYQKKSKLSKEAGSGEALILKLRYKEPDAAVGAESTLINFPVSDSGKGFSEMDQDFQFAASVAAFGMLLRNSPYKGDATFAAVEEIASGSADQDKGGYRNEFLQMVAKAKELRGE